MKIPYANCDFADIRNRGYFYVDKTPFLPHLEATMGNHLMFLRPRRFGKSTFISMLENYYDISLADRFDELFGGLWIHAHPTPNRSQYLVLRFNFAQVVTTGTEAEIRSSFSEQVKSAISLFVSRYRELVPSLKTPESSVSLSSANEDMGALMTEVLTAVGQANHQVYVLIDDYDHFGNRLFAEAWDDRYNALSRTTGFVRSFYASLKAFTRTSTIARTFITGVSPIMLDDLSSGFNIITHISQRTDFNALAGFTRSDVERGIDLVLQDNPELMKDPRIVDRQTLMTTMEKYYNGYRFSPHANEKLYNSTLVLYFLAQLKAEKRFPRKMLDLNVRTDYGRLYQIAKSASEHDNDTRNVLEEILTRESITVELVEQFGTRLTLGRPQIASLFYYMGMLTFADDSTDAEESKLVIPNRVMRELQWEYMQFALMDHDDIRISTGNLTDAMRKLAEQGDIEPLLAVFKEDVLKRLGLRETLTFNEQTMKLMLFAYLSQSKSFYLRTEVEMMQGYCDLLLGIRGPQYPGQYGWIIEAKYVPAKASKAAIDKAVEQGYAQIDKYTADKDLVRSLTLGRQFKAGVLVFVGLKDVQFRPWPRASNTPKKKRPKTSKGA